MLEVFEGPKFWGFCNHIGAVAPLEAAPGA
jgi:hypothetical protein